MPYPGKNNLQKAHFNCPKIDYRIRLIRINDTKIKGKEGRQKQNEAAFLVNLKCGIDQAVTVWHCSLYCR